MFLTWNSTLSTVFLLVNNVLLEIIMSLHVVVGAGPVGSAIACLLADRGDQVRLVTRSGSGPEHPGIDRRTADATDPEALARVWICAAGAVSSMASSTARQKSHTAIIARRCSAGRTRNE